jgi:uncharacterized protein with PIN domain
VDYLDIGGEKWLMMSKEEEEGSLGHSTRCPRCGAQNVGVAAGIRKIGGEIYDLHESVCWNCGLVYMDGEVQG